MVTPTITLRISGEYSLAASATLAASAAFVDKLYGAQRARCSTWRCCWKTPGTPWACTSTSRPAARCGPACWLVEVQVSLERLLSLDTDEAGFAALAARDPVVGELRARHSGTRPVLFPSPYEAAARAIIGHQLPVRQAAAITARIAEAHGVAVDLAGHELFGFPAPERLAALPPVRGLAARKVEQLRGLGEAAASGRLRSARLRALPRDQALADLQQPGIGPFSAELVMLRGVGEPDAFPRTKKRLHRAMTAAYDLGAAPDLAALEAVAERWRPYRNWAGLLLRKFQSVNYIT